MTSARGAMILRPQPWLAPFGALVGGAASLRAALYRHGLFSRARLRGPVISVGNLRVGGSGKTPVVAHLTRLLMAEGHAVAVLSRGYGGSFRGQSLVVSDGTTVTGDAALAGDEPIMLARMLPGAIVAVGPHRDVVGRHVEERFGPRVHVLDDGFQHLRLARDLDIVCVSPGDLGDRPLPAGWLREGRTALARAEVVLLGADGENGETVARAVRVLGTERTFVVRRRVRGFFALDGSPQPAPARPFLVSGIARPQRFVSDVASCVGTVAGHDAFGDHHVFGAADLGGVIARARTRRADVVVTTEKDLVRIAAWPGPLPLLVFGVEVAIDDEPRFRARVLAAVPARAA